MRGRRSCSPTPRSSSSALPPGAMASCCWRRWAATASTGRRSASRSSPARWDSCWPDSTTARWFTGSGFRVALAIGGGAYVLVGLFLATRPPFLTFVLAQVVLGYASGVLESVLNAYLASLPGARALLNQLHAFFGVGALLGPVVAAWIVGFASWTEVYLALAAAYLPLVVGFLVSYPRRQPAESAESAVPPPESPAALAELPGPRQGGGLLGAVLRERGILLGAAFLSVYVGLEIGMGNWGFSYLLE